MIPTPIARPTLMMMIYIPLVENEEMNPNIMHIILAINRVILLPYLSPMYPPIRLPIISPMKIV